MASLKDIAEATGVSIRTVSRVLKNDPHVSLPVRSRVMNTARELNYRPDPVARSLRMGKSFEVVAVAWSMDELFIAKLAGLEHTVRQNGYGLTLMFDSPGDPHDDQILNDVLQRRPAGVALLPGLDRDVTRSIRALHDEGIPYLVFDSLASEVDTVRIDRAQGVCEAVKYLERQGRKRIAYLGPPTSEAFSAKRYEGYTRAIEEMKREPIHMVTANYESLDDQFAHGRDVAHALQSWTTRPDAIQAFSDAYALGLLTGLHDRGIRVPDEIAIIGFDDRKAAAMSWPRLTTVAQPNREAGITAGDILLRKINDAPVPPSGWTQVLPTRLVVRETA